MHRVRRLHLVAEDRRGSANEPPDYRAIAAALDVEIGPEYVWNLARTHGINVNREYAEVFQVYRVIT